MKEKIKPKEGTLYYDVNRFNESWDNFFSTIMKGSWIERIVEWLHKKLN